MRSHSSLSLRIVIIRFLISWGVGILLRGSSFSSSSLLHRVFHRKAHSDAAIRKRRVASVLIFPLAPLIFRKGRAMIDVMWMPCGQGICFRVHSSFMTFQAWVQLFACFTVEDYG